MNDSTRKPGALQLQLIAAIEASEKLNLRFSKIKCVSADESKRRGVMSFVFSAHDDHIDGRVALKFVDPQYLGEPNYLNDFQREIDLLTRLDGKERCLQLVNGHEKFTWNIGKGKDGNELQLPIGYFATEWLDEDIDDFFFNQQNHDAAVKLVLFRDILLAVEAIHREKIFHRDIKIDNIRVRCGKGKKTIVIIDFGLAAGKDTSPLRDAYSRPMGAPAFSPPEAFTGFEGDRELGVHSDSYALGCLLFQLFNKTGFHFARGNHTVHEAITVMIAVPLLAIKDRAERERAWAMKMREFGNLLAPPQFDWDGHSVPMVCRDLLDRAYKALIRFDYRYRETDLAVVRAWIDSALRAYKNERKYARELERKRKQRQYRKEHAQKREERLKAYLGRRSA